MRLGKNIGRFWLWVGVLLLIELAAITLWKRWYWFFPAQQTSELYQRYAGAEGIDAAYVTDYRVNDSLFVNVTLLQSTTDSAWSRLTKDMNVWDMSDLDDSIRAMFVKPQAYGMYYKCGTTSVNGLQPTLCDVYSWNHYYKRFVVFHSVDSLQRREIVELLTLDITY